VIGLFPLIVPSELVHVMGRGSLTQGISFQMTVFSLIQVWVQPESIMALTVKFFPLVSVISGLITSSCTPRHF
jgi:hypothetical protein